MALLLLYALPSDDVPRMIYVVVVFWQGLWQAWPLVLLVAASIGAYLASSTPPLPASSLAVASGGDDERAPLFTPDAAQECRPNDTSAPSKLSDDSHGRILLQDVSFL